MKNYYTLTLSCLLLAGLLACSPRQTTTQEEGEHVGDYAFVGATVLTMQESGRANRAELLPNQTVWIKDGMIHQLGPDLNLPVSVQQIDATGKYLMPGLAEMHAHIPVPKEGDEGPVKETLFLWLSQGITTVRGMLGHPYHLELKDKVHKGELLGPRIFTSGPSMNGNSVPDVATAERMVREQKEAGYDFLKLHPGLTLEVFDRIVSVAKEVGIPYAGHVSVEVGIRHAIASHYASIDHVDGYLEGLVPNSAKVSPGSNGFFGFNFTHLADPSFIEPLAMATQEAEVAVVPTQSLMVRISSEKSPEEMAREPEMKYMSPFIVEQWQRSKYGFQRAENYQADRVARFIELRQMIIKRLQDQGVLMLLGSDSPQIFNVPGFSIHHEIAGLEDAGLSPYQILQSGTCNPARYVGTPDAFGKVAAGAAADLILLPGNPLENLDHLKNHAGVMVRGIWLTREEIDRELARIAAAHAE